MKPTTHLQLMAVIDFTVFLKQATPARKPAPAKDDSFFGAFQGLSLEGLMGSSNGPPAAAASVSPGDQCKVM